MLRRTIVVFGVLLLLRAGFAWADTETKEVLTTGHGASPKEAVADALAEAVRQINGITVDAKQFLESSSTQTMRSDSTGQQDQLNVSAHVEQGIDIRGSGLIAGYEVLSNEPSELGYTTNLRARVLRYSPTGNDSADRRRLAVIPRASVRSSYNVYSSLTGDELTDRYVSALEAALVQSRRFAVLDRNENGALAEERARWKSSDAPLAEQAKLGQSLGVDYLMFTRILDANAGISTDHIALTDEYISHRYADIKVEVRVVLAPTGEVKFAETITLGLADLGGSDAQSMLDKVAGRVASVVTERIYPMQIIGQQQQEYVLNQGGRSVKVGEQFRVVQRGAELTDPYTHESLGFAENEVATIQVTRVDGRVSYARLVNGAAAVVQSGMSLRRAGMAVVARPRSAPPAEKTAGVKLPFDR